MEKPKNPCWAARVRVSVIMGGGYVEWRFLQLVCDWKMGVAFPLRGGWRISAFLRWDGWLGWGGVPDRFQ
jgi:hypothetical protein